MKRLLRIVERIERPMQGNYWHERYVALAVRHCALEETAERLRSELDYEKEKALTGITLVSQGFSHGSTTFTASSKSPSGTNGEQENEGNQGSG